MRKSHIPVTLITGFLGSGKTTLLNQLVGQPELADALVIINEFGEMSLDHALVTHSTENVVMEMSNGCVCCNIRGDLVKTLADATWRFSRNGQRQFSRVLVEATGLADPAPVIQTLMTHPRLTRHYFLDGVVTTVDAKTGQQSLNAHDEAVKQAAVADVLLLTKADLVRSAEYNGLSERLEALNPTASRRALSHGQIEAKHLLNLGVFHREGRPMDVSRWLGVRFQPGPGFMAGGILGQSLASGGDQATHHHDDRIGTFSFEFHEAIPEALLAPWLTMVSAMLGADLLRLKGIVNVADNEQPVVIHGVQHVMHPPVRLARWPDDDRRSRLVFITRDLSRSQIASAVAALRSGIDRRRAG